MRHFITFCAFVLLVASGLGQVKLPLPAGHDMHSMGHVAAATPVLKEKSSYVWTDAMDWDTRTGFGKMDPMVRMMILMMVGGSGFEGMKMAPMEMTFSESTFVEGGMEAMTPVVTDSIKVEVKLNKGALVGDNAVVVTLTSAGGKPLLGAKIAASVGMTNMDMGTAHPAVKELGKGKYAVSVKFSMMGPWRLSLIVTLPGGKPSTHKFDFEAK